MHFWFGMYLEKSMSVSQIIWQIITSYLIALQINGPESLRRTNSVPGISKNYEGSLRMLLQSKTSVLSFHELRCNPWTQTG